MDTKGPINPPSHNKFYIHVIIDAFSHFVVTVPIKSNNAKTAIKTVLHHWIIIFGPLIYLVTEFGSEYVNNTHPILADYGTDQFSIRINDKGIDIVVEPLTSFSFESGTPFQTKFKTPNKKEQQNSSSTITFT